MVAAIREWICFEHHKYEPGDPKRFGWDRAVKWHNDRLPMYPVPQSVEQAIELQYPIP